MSYPVQMTRTEANVTSYIEQVVVKRVGTSRAHIARQINPNIVPTRTLCGKYLGPRRVLVNKRWDDLLAAGSQYSGDRMCPQCRDINLGRA